MSDELRISGKGVAFGARFDFDFQCEAFCCDSTIVVYSSHSESGIQDYPPSTILTLKIILVEYSSYHRQLL